MAQVALKLSGFEGPLELLMHLIEKDKIDLYDIPIVSITEQYIGYLKAMSEFDMELASEFLVMAATLLQIKSRMLLPKEELVDSDEEVDPRQQLVEMLLEYRRIKECARLLFARKEEAQRCITRPPMFKDIVDRVLPTYSVVRLLEALSNMLSSTDREEAYIEPQAFSVQEKMADILEKLKLSPGFTLSELVASELPDEKVACFLGVLELLKLKLITISQKEAFAPIYIFAREGEDDVI